MARRGWQIVTRGKAPQTTRPSPCATRPEALVKREFKASAPNQLWVADITYVPVQKGFVYTAFVIDVCSRRIVRWRVDSSLHTQ